MPILLQDKVPDPRAPDRSASIPMLTLSLKQLAEFATAYEFPSNDSLADVWLKRAELRLKQIFTVARLYSNFTEVNEWWRQLQCDVYHWLKIKYAVLRYALKELGVPAIDIVGQIVSVRIIWFPKL